MLQQLHRSLVWVLLKLRLKLGCRVSGGGPVRGDPMIAPAFSLHRAAFSFAQGLGRTRKAQAGQAVVLTGTRPSMRKRIAASVAHGDVPSAPCPAPCQSIVLLPGS